MAQNKALWTDELYSLRASVINQSYLDIVSGKIDEGNNCPLFYLIQKVIIDSASFLKIDFANICSEDIADDMARIILRISPVIFMSLSAVILFYFFAREYSLKIGLYSFLIAISSYMFWAYWIEARPYALWMFLTVLQCVFFLRYVMNSEKREIAWRYFIVVNILLALTASLSLIQNFALALVLWARYEKRISKYWLLFILPTMISAYYYILAPKYNFWFLNSWVEVISANLPKDRVLVILFYIVFILVYYVNKFLNLGKNKTQGLNNVYYEVANAFLSFSLLTISGFLLFVAYLKIVEPIEKVGFIVSNRYFMPLTVIGIMAMIVFPVSLIKSTNNKIFKIVLIVLVGVLVLFRLIKGYQLVKI